MFNTKSKLLMSVRTIKSVHTDDGFNRPIRSLSRLFRGIIANNNKLFTFISNT